MEPNNTTENIQKPASLEIAEFRNSLISRINDSHLHPSILGMVLREVVNSTLSEISAYEKKEIASYHEQVEPPENK